MFTKKALFGDNGKRNIRGGGDRAEGKYVCVERGKSILAKICPQTGIYQRTSYITKVELWERKERVWAWNGAKKGKLGPCPQLWVKLKSLGGATVRLKNEARWRSKERGGEGGAGKIKAPVVRRAV